MLWKKNPLNKQYLIRKKVICLYHAASINFISFVYQLFMTINSIVITILFLIYNCVCILRYNGPPTITPSTLSNYCPHLRLRVRFVNLIAVVFLRVPQREHNLSSVFTSDEGLIILLFFPQQQYISYMKQSIFWKKIRIPLEPTASRIVQT